MPNISRDKGNQTTKFAREAFFFRNHAENVAERLVPHLFFKKVLHEVENKWSAASFDIIR